MQQTANSFWAWAHNILLPGLYYSQTYIGQSTKPDDLKYIANALAIRMGPARLRQLRVKPGKYTHMYICTVILYKDVMVLIAVVNGAI